ncbi:hypothetical protein ES703_58822 [subsurface metagenome]
MSEILHGYELYKFFNERPKNSDLTRKEEWFEQIGYVPWKPTQFDFHISDKRFKVWHAGTRSGKSLASARDVEPMILYGGTKGWIIGPTYSDGEFEFRYLLNDFLRQQFKFVNLSDSVKTGKMYFRIEGLHGLSSVDVKSGKDIAKLGGESLDWALLVEASSMNREVWEGNIRQRLTDRRGIAAFTTTPKGRNWTYRLHNKGQEANDEWVSFVSKTIQNPYIEKEEIESAKRDISPDMFRQTYEAGFITFAGRIYKNFSVENNVREIDYSEDLPLFPTFDFGFMTPAVCLYIQVRKEDELIYIYVIDEIYKTLLTHKKFGQICREITTEKFSRKEDRSFGDISKPEAIAEMKESGFYISGRQTTKEFGFEQVRKLLNPEKIRLFVSGRCKNFIREMINYQYKPTRTGNFVPADIDDHGPDAFREFVVNYLFARPNIRSI